MEERTVNITVTDEQGNELATGKYTLKGDTSQLVINEVLGNSRIMETVGPALHIGSVEEQEQEQD